jgi:hypothetical protein
MKAQCLSVNAIHNKRFIHAGEILDTDTLASLPDAFRRYLVPAESESEETEQVATSFQLNTSYGVDKDGRLLQRNLERQAAEQLAAAERQDAMEEQLISEIENPDATIAAALEQAQEEHNSSVNLQKAQAEVNTRHQEEADKYLEEMQRAESTLADDEGFSPSLEDQDQPNGAEIPQPPAPEVAKPKPPRKMRKRFVNRNGVWLQVKRLKRFHTGEGVFVKQGGKFVEIGKVNKNGKPPACYLEN